MIDPSAVTPEARELSDLGARFDHVAIGAPSFDALLPVYRDLLGGTFLYGGHNDTYGFRVATYGYHDGSKVELIVPSPGSMFLDSFLARSGGLGGLHHVTFVVPDLVLASHALDAQGIAYFGMRLGQTWSELFVHPKAAQGVLLQLAQIGAQWLDAVDRPDEASVVG